MRDTGWICWRVGADAARIIRATTTGALLLALLASDATAGERPADTFFDRLRALCQQAFVGQIEIDRPAPAAPDPFAGKPLQMHVRSCSDAELRIPFHVGDDRSRTWVLRRTADGLRLKHDHRHADGSADRLTQYGGGSRGAGSALRQEFPADAESIALFRAADREVSVSNVWALEFAAESRFVYELARPDGRLFRVVFDLSRPIAPPPPPWGATD